VCAHEAYPGQRRLYFLGTSDTDKLVGGRKLRSHEARVKVELLANDPEMVV
jgi:hypothetical protein